MLTVPTSVLRRSLEQLRACGKGRTECVVYWLGPLDHPNTIEEIAHPVHTATAAGYDVDGPWLNELWLRLARERLELRAQVHTHPGAAYHSSRDDAMAALQTESFISLVIPDFALGGDPLTGAHLVERAADGLWHDLDPLTRLSIR
jgi:hypothetical protein